MTNGLPHREEMTSTTWILGGTESEKILLGRLVRQRVAAWGAGHVEVLVDNRVVPPVVASAMEYPFTSAAFDATARVQAAID
jgi:hypothetical protein